ncbi:MAG: hypothetical protein L0Y58_12790 [Verrucomicrobia subdivision 3 bacterium]|nr:hypothetical protein [Limisphaerales bacterium]
MTKYAVRKYDGRIWNTVLFPYRAKSIHRELTGLRAIAIGTNGNVWIGATVYLKPTGPWTHEGSIWIADQAQVPSTAPLFEFDGKSWKAYGPAHGLDVKKYGCAVPELDELGRILVTTPKGFYVLEGETWNLSKPSAKRWVLRERRGRFTAGSALFYRDGEDFVEVRATEHRTGEVLDLHSDQRVSLCFVEDRGRGCVWLGTWHGLYRVWREAGVPRKDD